MMNKHQGLAVLYHKFNNNLSTLRAEFHIDLIESDAQNLAIYLSKTCNKHILTKRVSYYKLARSILCCSLLKTYYSIPETDMFACRSTTYSFVKTYREQINLWLIDNGYYPMNQHKSIQDSKRSKLTLS